MDKLDTIIEMLKELLRRTEPKKEATFMEGTDINSIEGECPPYQCAIYNNDGTERIRDLVEISVNGRTYTKYPDENGLYKLNINLAAGNYPLIAKFNGNDIYEASEIHNTITINHNIPRTKKQIVLGCDRNTDMDSYVQNTVASRLEGEGYPVEKLAIEPNAFASYDWSSKAKGKIGIYLIASGLFSIADAYENNNGFDNYVFGIRGDFNDKGATCFDCPIRPDADCTSICDKFANKSFNQINAMTQPKIAVCGGATTDELADNIIDWLTALENRAPEEQQEEQSAGDYSTEILQYFESKFGNMTCIDDCLEAIQGNGYGYYYDDVYSNIASINNMYNGTGVNCTDSCHVFWHLAKALGYAVDVLHIQCAGGDGHVRLRLYKDSTGEFYRDPAAVLDGNSLDYNWCTSGYVLDVNPDWFMENLYR